MKRSDAIANLAAALSVAQGQMEGAKKDSANPFFKSKYADLASVWDAIRQPLAANQLAVMQFPRSTAEGVEIETLLCHSSGEWVSETLSLPVAKHDPQGIGSAITYGRRYGLQSVIGIAPEDDDGNAAVAVGNNKAVVKKVELAPKQPPKLIDEKQHAALKKLLSDTGTDPAAFCQHYGIDDTDRLPAVRFDEAVELLEKKRRKEGAGKVPA